MAEKKLDLTVKWIPPEQAPLGHNPSIELFARLLRPEVFRLVEESEEALRLD